MKHFVGKIAALCAATAGCALAFAGCGENGGVDISGGKYRYDDSQNYLAGSSGEYAANLVSDLSVEWIAGEVILREGEGDNITFTETTTETDNDYLMHYSLERGELKIRFQEDRTNVRNNFSKTLVVEYPRGFRFTDVELDTASASITVSDLSCGELDIDTASGAMNIGCAGVTEVSVDSASGPLVIYGKFNELDCDMASGNTTVYFPQDVGFRAKFKSASGKVNNSTEAVYQNKMYVLGNGQVLVDVDSASGNLILNTMAE